MVAIATVSSLRPRGSIAAGPTMALPGSGGSTPSRSGGDRAAEGAHAGSVTNEPESWDGRRHEIMQRRASINARLDELKMARQDDQSQATSRERAESAQRNLAASQAAAGRALAASAYAFRRAAQAHERAARHHERAAAAGFGDKDKHEQRAAIHRTAQARDIQRADKAESLVPDDCVHWQDSEDLPETG